MKSGNKTLISQYLLLGFSEELELQPFLFGLFLPMYLFTIFGNLLIILATITDSHLHKLMYFFLSNLCLSDICFISSTIPKMWVNLQTQRKVISYERCFTQMFFFLLLAVLEKFFLTVMAYDCFLAICHPLQYMVVMNPWLCALLVLGSWIISALRSLLYSLLLLQLSFCTHLEIYHFFCELNQMFHLVFSDTFIKHIVIYFATELLGVGTIVGILFSYFKTVSTICTISSDQRKYKAFSTCMSHLSAVSLFYCTSLGAYFSSAGTHNTHSNAAVSVMYAVVTPMLNPFIYTLRNKDIKRDLKKFCRWKSKKYHELCRCGSAFDCMAQRQILKLLFSG